MLFTLALFLSTSHDEKTIKEVFEWVEDDADITIVLCGGLFCNVEPIQPNQGEISIAVELEESDSIKVAELPSKPQQPAANKEKKPASTPESTSIRVGIDKVDSLINMVGELVITQAMLNQLSEQEITPATIS